MAFEGVVELANELEGLEEDPKVQADPALRQRVLTFIKNVCDEADKAFGDIEGVLTKISSLPSGVPEVQVTALHEQLIATYSREKFKNVQKICDRLDELARDFDQTIKPQLDAANVQHGSQLFYLLNKHEGAFMYTIENALWDLDQQLLVYQQGDDIIPIRQKAAALHRDLRNGIGEMRRIRVSAEAMEQGGPKGLLDWEGVANEVQNRSKMASTGGIQALRDVLVTLYPNASMASLVATQAKLNVQLIDFSGPPIQFWHAILTVANNNNQVQDVINVARAQFPGNEALLKAEQLFQSGSAPRTALS